MIYTGSMDFTCMGQLQVICFWSIICSKSIKVSILQSQPWPCETKILSWEVARGTKTALNILKFLQLLTTSPQLCAIWLGPFMSYDIYCFLCSWRVINVNPRMVWPMIWQRRLILTLQETSYMTMIPLHCFASVFSRPNLWTLNLWTSRSFWPFKHYCSHDGIRHAHTHTHAHTRVKPPVFKDWNDWRTKTLNNFTETLQKLHGFIQKTNTELDIDMICRVGSPLASCVVVPNVRGTSSHPQLRLQLLLRNLWGWRSSGWHAIASGPCMPLLHPATSLLTGHLGATLLRWPRQFCASQNWQWRNKTFTFSSPQQTISRPTKCQAHPNTHTHTQSHTPDFSLSPSFVCFDLAWNWFWDLATNSNSNHALLTWSEVNLSCQRWLSRDTWNRTSRPKQHSVQHPQLPQFPSRV